MVERQADVSTSRGGNSIDELTMTVVKCMHGAGKII